MHLSLKSSLFTFLTGLSAVLAPSAGWATTFHVAPKGSDSNPGTLEQPVATLEAARDAARKSGKGPHVITVTPEKKDKNWLRPSHDDPEGEKKGTKGTGWGWLADDAQQRIEKRDSEERARDKEEEEDRAAEKQRKAEEFEIPGKKLKHEVISDCSVREEDVFGRKVASEREGTNHRHMRHEIAERRQSEREVPVS